MSIILALLLQTAGNPPRIECSGPEAQGALAKQMEASPGPLGVTIARGSDMEGAQVLLGRTTHHVGVPLIQGRRGAEKFTYYVESQSRICKKELSVTTCPSLEFAVSGLRYRAYPVMHNRDKVREGSAFHPPFAMLNVQDGDGNTYKISSQWPGHPIHSDIKQAFDQISRCTEDADKAVHEF